MREILLRKRYLKEDYQKALEKLTLFFFRTQPLLMDKVIKSKKGPGTSDQSLSRLQNKFRKITLLVIYYLTKFDDIL